MSITDTPEVLVKQELMEKIKTLPMTLTVKDVSGFLGICLTSAYKLVAQDDFPKIKMPGIRRVVIPKIKFVEWYLGNSH